MDSLIDGFVVGIISGVIYGLIVSKPTLRTVILSFWLGVLMLFLYYLWINKILDPMSNIIYFMFWAELVILAILMYFKSGRIS